VQHADYFPDLAFLAPPQTPSVGPRPGICLSFRQTIPEVHNRQCYETRLSQALTALVRSFDANTARCTDFCHQVDEDAEFNGRLSAAAGVPRHVPRLTLSSYEAYYQSARIVVSNRLHCLLLGAYCGAVPVALTSREHTKLIALFETLGWTTLILLIDDVATLAEKFTMIQKDWSKLGSIVQSSFENQRRLGHSILEQRFGAAGRRQGTPA
jgi:hypothetical protein